MYPVHMTFHNGHIQTTDIPTLEIYRHHEITDYKTLQVKCHLEKRKKKSLWRVL